MSVITRYRSVARRVYLDFEIRDLCRFQGLSLRGLSPLLAVIGQGRAFVVEDENGILGVVAEIFWQLVCAVGVIPDLLQARDLPLNGTRIGRGAGGCGCSQCRLRDSVKSGSCCPVYAIR